jgi:hypothetical protein
MTAETRDSPYRQKQSADVPAKVVPANSHANFSREEDNTNLQKK